MSDTEERARNMGWVPLDEFRGPEESWKSAEDFLRIGENFMPVLKERLGKLEGELSKVRGELTSKSESLTKLAAWHRGTYKRQYEKALRDIKAQKKVAVEESDTDRYDALEQQEVDLLREAAENDPDLQTTAPGTVPEYFEFQEKNPWYGSDPEMTMYASGLQAILTQYEGINDDKTFFQEVEKRVRKRFPDKFRNANQALPNAVEGMDSTAGGGDGGTKKGWGDLPADAKAAYTNNFTDIMKKDEYAKEYWLQEGV